MTLVQCVSLFLRYFLLCLSKDYDIIEVYKAVFDQQPVEYFLHDSLACLCCVCKTHRQGGKFVPPGQEYKGCLVTAFWVDFDLPVAAGQVKCGKPLLTC